MCKLRSICLVKLQVMVEVAVKVEGEAVVEAWL